MNPQESLSLMLEELDLEDEDVDGDGGILDATNDVASSLSADSELIARSHRCLREVCPNTKRPALRPNHR